MAEKTLNWWAANKMTPDVQHKLESYSMVFPDGSRIYWARGYNGFAAEIPLKFYRESSRTK